MFPYGIEAFSKGYVYSVQAEPSLEKAVYCHLGFLGVRFRQHEFYEDVGIEN
jgi:hypothetical protein